MSWVPSLFVSSSEKKETKVKHVYIISCENSDMHKIGRTSGSVQKRLKSLQTGNPNKLGIYLDINVRNDSELEAKMHQFFKEKRGKIGEWFLLDKKDLKKIKRAYRKCGSPVLDTDIFIEYLGKPSPKKEEESEGFFKRFIRKLWW